MRMDGTKIKELVLAKQGTESKFGVMYRERRALLPEVHLDLLNAIDVDCQYPIVVYVHPFGAGKRAGIQKGWLLHSVDGESIHGLSAKDAIAKFNSKRQATVVFDSTHEVKLTDAQHSQQIETAQAPFLLKDVYREVGNKVTNPILLDSDAESDTEKSSTAYDSIQARASRPSTESGISAHRSHTIDREKHHRPSKRSRRSHTVALLLEAGYEEPDVLASVNACGDSNPELCVEYIATQLVEQRFNRDIAQASIASEATRQEEADKLRRKKEAELEECQDLTGSFPNSHLLSSTSKAQNLRRAVVNDLHRIRGKCEMRSLLVEILRLETKSLRWFEEGAQGYFEHLASRLEAAFQGHNLLQCCANASSQDVACSFVQILKKEKKELRDALFLLDTYDGGLPSAFRKYIAESIFSMDEDGFEIE